MSQPISNIHAATGARLRDSQTHPVASVAPADTLTPADRYHELFVDIQLGGIFADSKTFVDCAPKGDPNAILEAYRAEKSQPGFNLHRFVDHYFSPQVMDVNDYVSDPNQSLPGHIDGLWNVLTRYPKEHPLFSSLLPLPNPYVVPGGRFSELYYWDSYFTMLGLVSSGRKDLLLAMADNFAYLIDTYGLIPNGTRTYYLSRSQPPVFSLMVELFEEEGGQPAVIYLSQLRKEYAYWMDGAEQLRPGEVHRQVVCLPDGAVLNRYWDDRDTPREESYAEDVDTARHSTRPLHQVYRELRAGAASGWDFSSRWLETAGELHSIRTTSILPVDLNSFLHKLESKIAQLSDASGDAAAATEFRAKADARRKVIDDLMWCKEQGAYFDYDWELGQRRDHLTAATAVPLFVGIADEMQAMAVARTIRRRLLEDGGIVTTEFKTGEQWDQPNGWAPLQWMAIQGLLNYDHKELANEISARWLSLVANLYQRESKLVEKYNLHADRNVEGGRGGEYPLQDGFGWTNGVTRRLLQNHPWHHAWRSQAGE